MKGGLLQTDQYDHSPAFDGWIDPLPPDANSALRRHVGHQTLLRAYQARYIVLPETAPPGGVLAGLDRHYDPGRLDALHQRKGALEATLIEPLWARARATLGDGDVLAYAERMIPELRAVKGDPFLDALASDDHRLHHYRNFLLQSSADLLAEASASALSCIGEYGAPQSALFRILIDEFGYGAHDKKHAVLYRATMRSFGLDDAYNGYSRLFDTNTLTLHNAIHWLFQTPRNIFGQVGFLLFAETAYQRSTLFHARYLSRYHPGGDARYFAEHAHIDLHHTKMVLDEVVKPFVDRFGAEVEPEIIAGAELTRLVFALSGAGLLELVRAFKTAPSVVWGLGDHAGTLVAPGTPVRDPQARIQVGAIGQVDAAAFAAFPDGAVGRLAEPLR